MYGQEIVLVSETSTPSLKPKQPPTQRVTGLLRGGEGGEANYSPPSSAKVKNEWSLTSSQPTCPHVAHMESFAPRLCQLILPVPLPPTFIHLHLRFSASGKLFFFAIHLLTFNWVLSKPGRAGDYCNSIDEVRLIVSEQPGSVCDLVFPRTVSLAQTVDVFEERTDLSANYESLDT